MPAAAKAGDAEADDGAVGFRSVWAANRALIIAMVLLLIAYLIITVTVPMFRTIGNLIAFLVLEAILVFAFKVSGVFVHGRSAFIGLIVLIALIVISAFTIDGFLSAANIKAVLLFAAFLGIACVGQTLVALMGGLDLSIPFVIGAANIGLLYLIGLGVPSWLALRGGHYHRRLDRLPEWGPVLQAAGPGADRYTRDGFCRGRPSSNCHQYRLSVQRQRFRDGAVLALQSRSHERQRRSD